MSERGPWAEPMNHAVRGMFGGVVGGAALLTGFLTILAGFLGAWELANGPALLGAGAVATALGLMVFGYLSLSVRRVGELTRHLAGPTGDAGLEAAYGHAMVLLDNAPDLPEEAVARTRAEVAAARERVVSMMIAGPPAAVSEARAALLVSLRQLAVTLAPEDGEPSGARLAEAVRNLEAEELARREVARLSLPGGSP